MLGFGGMRVTAASSLLLGFFTTCCWAWPSPYRRSYNYYPELEAPTNPWDLAQEPLSYDQPENYYVDTEDLLQEPEPDTNSQWSDIQALTNLMEMYDTAPVSTWGQIVNEKPESELEELKHLKKHHEPESPPAKAPAEKVIFSTAAPQTAAASKAQPQKTQSAPQIIRQHPQGQKEIPLLRPPNQPKVVEPLPVLTQRSVDVEKPSPYDTLRKYLSIEDALKKEAEKRRDGGSSRNNLNLRQKKRSYVTDEDTLTGQLNNLKKSLV